MSGWAGSRKEAFSYKFRVRRTILVQSGCRKAPVSHKMIGLVFLALLGAAGKARLQYEQWSWWKQEKDN